MSIVVAYSEVLGLGLWFAWGPSSSIYRGEVNLKQMSRMGCTVQELKVFVGSENFMVYIYISTLIEQQI